MSYRNQLLEILADGKFHLREELVRILGVPEGKILALLRDLEYLDIDVQVVPGQGYRLPRAIEFLSRESILSALCESSDETLSGLEILPDIDSTNRYLMDKAAASGLPNGYVCLAERQSRGRGRWGRRWVSPYASNVYLSILWNFALSPAALPGLVLATGVGVTRALGRLGIQDTDLKWPNDVLWNGAKLAGILLEMGGYFSESRHVVIGVGLNIGMPTLASDSIDQSWVDCESAMGRAVSRNKASADLIRDLLKVAAVYQEDGLAPFLEEWRQRDCIAGQEVKLYLPDGSAIRGIAQGIDDSGSLLVRGGGRLHAFHTGEVSLRESP